MAQIYSTTAKTITIAEAYKNFENLFSTKNASYLPLHEDHNDAIDLVDNKYPPYSLIYSLSKNELSIFWAYIDKNLANRFIKPFKSPAGASIFLFPNLIEACNYVLTTKVSKI